MQNETIAALSTALGESAIAIVRLSGPQSRRWADCLFRGRRPLAETEPRFMSHGRLVDERGEPFDEVLAVWFAPGRSYTGEEMAEIHCHGGNMAARLCLERLHALGARPAKAGEFTQRAFLSGRIDLAQAEAILATIRARSEAGLKAAQKSLAGDLSRRAATLREKILDLSALVEAGLDYPDEELPPLTGPELVEELRSLSGEAHLLFDRCRTGLLLSQGIAVALVGKPNVGKSSLLNALLARPRALVTAVAGTTRDVLEAPLSHRGVPLHLLDTAGLRVPLDEVEALGIDRTMEALERADLALLVLDGSAPLDDDDRRAASRLVGRPHLTLVNKSDLPHRVGDDEARALSPSLGVLRLSAREGEGIEALKETVVDTVVGSGLLDEALNASASQLEELRLARSALDEARRLVREGLGEDVAAANLTEARSALDRLLFLDGDDALAERIFSRFCVGK
ncbi:tRNA uridine-5-carboxymethylaminomethyl(34) synthesis GTPase MnmE [Aminithiophilus ramosus]|uniref:tRNA modification GTPase MnmE n=1 Tax=Aminithiophilus ramosus TaxID=3029084 RepID=A0A9Q7EX94_9BACT|nr:tRNA uridine-5-carboxymethylaminomethyl(34) synthesis GTPase MnmE [Aminithiophilus ramosus]QTX33474.1 tRNA uridine-5-carboxymethylaminomethyl(34) synthesis GTPase MnmE [Aminithiophilus ramosus]